LRNAFPIQRGDVFSRQKIADGLEMLRRTYDESGYLNFTAVPETSVDNNARLISLVIEIDEGKQFHFGTITIIGLDDATRQAVLKDAPSGQIYDHELLDRFLAKYTSVFKLRPDDPRLLARRMDEKSGTVSTILYACPCPTC
jgi:outer membrane protein assembly factor BamA